ncbi:MAG: CDP-glycerol glycerophosphotransferase family protein [Blautia sp.]|uniref:CDP-glycerol glycerophosphotransferase family protein n=1 Tax=Blautia TaxID=572511 RepID=UPI00156F0CA0|nr:CDP-glycerol glycerophosphotransferase family protein [Blautia glucerasea]MEE0424757.1 CDP-glycerol glycerophosphotransferase family protein [Blautia sp.]NSJ27053.1 hypothetical protein [Blautia glucerasea]
MNLNAIKKKIRDEGLMKSAGYYSNRVISKLSMHVVGRLAARHGQAKKNRIVFKNREMLDFTDNPRALFEYLEEKGYNEKYQIIYMVSEKKNFRSRHYKNVKFVTAESPGGFSSPAAFYYGATAGYFFYSHNSADLNRFHRKGQITVNLWHGCGYKGASLDNKNIPHSTTMSAFDYCLVPGQVFARSKSECWNWPKEKILCMGYPRYDWMLDPGNDRKEILERLGFHVEPDTKVVVWMPTFRKSVLTGYGENEISLPYQLPGIEDPAQMAQLDRHCGKEKILLLIKKHPLQTGWEQENCYKNIRYVTDEMFATADVVLYRLLGVCDGLISDYSSVAVDYMLLDRPMAFVLTDLPAYGQLRGFVFKDPLAYMPGEKVYDFGQLLTFLTHVREGKDLFAKERQLLLLEMHNPCKDYRGRLLDFLNIRCM